MSFSHRRDYYAGALMVLVGGGAAYVGSHYQMGSLTQMGPGYFPTALGVVLAIIGIIIAGGAAFTPATEPVTAEAPAVKPDWRGWLCITGAAALFIALSDYVGLVAATFACVFVAAMGDRENSWKEAALLAAGITVFGVILFSFILHIQIPLFGSM
ncbi:MAG TPA: tripartite tricarboxylate transporter TctB family protein [Stellaceae bacterium]|jgi:putative Ca2+/H+ antiporter (TMEM165/GDT1 family)|nr:tripartite tricarboxylate transporter TctB family protein [Stellaceae bacterium]